MRLCNAVVVNFDQGEESGVSEPFGMMMMKLMMNQRMYSKCLNARVLHPLDGLERGSSPVPAFATQYRYHCNAPPEFAAPHRIDVTFPEYCKTLLQTVIV